MTLYQCFNKKLNSKGAGIILGVLIILLIYLFSQEYLRLQNEIFSLAQTEANVKKITREIIQERVLYVIDFGDGNIKSYWLILPGNSTVFSLLGELAQRENFKVESRMYKEVGVFVESIDGIKNGTDNKYWQYWVNGELPMVAADKKEVKKGDKIEWKFAPSSF